MPPELALVGKVFLCRFFNFKIKITNLSLRFWQVLLPANTQKYYLVLNRELQQKVITPFEGREFIEDNNHKPFLQYAFQPLFLIDLRLMILSALQNQFQLIIFVQIALLFH